MQAQDGRGKMVVSCFRFIYKINRPFSVYFAVFYESYVMFDTL